MTRSLVALAVAAVATGAWAHATGEWSYLVAGFTFLAARGLLRRAVDRGPRAG